MKIGDVLTSLDNIVKRKRFVLKSVLLFMPSTISHFVTMLDVEIMSIVHQVPLEEMVKGLM